MNDKSQSSTKATTKAGPKTKIATIALAIIAVGSLLAATALVINNSASSSPYYNTFTYSCPTGIKTTPQSMSLGNNCWDTYSIRSWAKSQCVPIGYKSLTYGRACSPSATQMKVNANKIVYPCEEIGDKGKDYSIKGTVKIGITESTDQCISVDTWTAQAKSPWLMEFYCTASDGLANWEFKQCDNGCQDGACRPTSAAKNWYISSTVTVNGDGSSWSKPWKDFRDENWNNVNPGDTVYIDGGPTGLTYNEKLNPPIGGRIDAKIYIKRSTENGHNGKVTFTDEIKLYNPYLVLDGGDYNSFIVNAGSKGGGSRINIGGNGDGTGSEVRNISIVGKNYDTSYNEVSLGIYANDVTAHGIRFYQSGGEDMIAVGWANATIENCIFDTLYDYGTGPAPKPHRDLVSAYIPKGKKLIFRNNIMVNIQTDTLMILEDNNKPLINHGKFEIYGNVFYGNDKSIHFDKDRIKSIEYAKIYNNIFVNTFTCDGCEVYPTAMTIKNNIYVGSNLKGSEYSLYYRATPDTGTGNKSGDPKFLNFSKPLGNDNKPFTSDDGIKITAGSPAIASGSFTNINYPYDILGRAIGGVLDLGPYKY